MRQKIITVLGLLLLLILAIFFRIHTHNTQAAAAMAPLSVTLSGQEPMIEIAQIIQDQDRHLALLRMTYSDGIIMGVCRELRWSLLKGWFLVDYLGPHVIWEQDLSPNLATFNEPFPRSGDTIAFPQPGSHTNSVTFGFSEVPGATKARLYLGSETIEADVIKGSFIFIYPPGKIVTRLEILDAAGKIIEVKSLEEGY